MIELDGSHLEGGGSLVRVALALSTLTGKEFKVTNIRSGRPQPGLKPQHLTAIKALKEICNAETNDIHLGSTELTFKPGKVKKGIYDIDIGTAGSITLSLQALILPCLFAPAKVTLNVTGGTCGKWQAGVDYLQNILLPQLQRFVDKIEIKILKRGYYPKGGGKISLEISPRFKFHQAESLETFFLDVQAKTKPIKLTQQGEIEQIKGIVNVSAELEDVGDRIKMAAERAVKEYNVPTNIRVEYTNSFSVGGEIVMWAVCSQDGQVDFDNPVLLGGDALVEKRKVSEDVGKEAAQELKEQVASGAAVDHHLADQLIFYMGLLPGSEIKASELTNHTKTNIYVVEKFLAVKFSVEGNVVKVEKS